MQVTWDRSRCVFLSEQQYRYACALYEEWCLGQGRLSGMEVGDILLRSLEMVLRHRLSLNLLSHNLQRCLLQLAPPPPQQTYVTCDERPPSEHHQPYGVIHLSPHHRLLLAQWAVSMGVREDTVDDATVGWLLVVALVLAYHIQSWSSISWWYPRGIDCWDLPGASES